GWLDLLEADIRSAVSDTVLKDAPIIRVSAKTKTGLNELISSLQSLLQQKPARPDLNRPRLPIDRVFTMSGFGTVVTGTLSDGHLAAGDEVEILPKGLKGRIRGLQTHKKKEERAVPGSRTAVNISGVDVEQIQRGDVLAHPNQYQAVRRVEGRQQIAPPWRRGQVLCWSGRDHRNTAPARHGGTGRRAGRLASTGITRSARGSAR
ncbi:MAG TPA: EF-Tu/IF-2/RF-3 family GTPase, partial [Anaerolineales bacterium]|nr:EF-Tu/IF-2/RF-3 family GTPase [Anaerolineales bacterium]